MRSINKLEKVIDLEDTLRAEYEGKLEAAQTGLERVKQEQAEQQEQLQATIDQQLETIRDLTAKATANQQVEHQNRELTNRSENQQEQITTLKKRVKALQKDLANEREQLKELTQYDPKRMKKNLDANKKKLAVIGAGPAGLSFAMYAADRGHDVHLFDQASEIGGQFNYAKQIPGKEEFYETIRYFKKQIELHQVQLKLNTKVDAELLKTADFDEVIIAIPRSLLADAELIAEACEEEGIKLRFIADIFNVQVARISLLQVGNIPHLTMEPVLRDPQQMFLKRLFDLVVVLSVAPIFPLPSSFVL